jgi:hypothetical protein
MPGPGSAAPVLSRLVVALSALVALRALTLLDVSVPVPDPPDVERPRDPGRWSVSIDGWTIEIDGMPVALRGLQGQEEEAEGDEEDGVVHEVHSPFDALIVGYSESVGLDWRLVAALIYEESRFRPDAESSAGAYGLMQVRSIAAQQVGERHYREPAANIRTGTRYLRYCFDLFAGASWRDRLALALAAYNMGPAHVQDAQQLARRYNLDPLRWDGAVAVTTQLLAAPHVCEKLPSGCALGMQVVAYVERVLTRFATYRRLYPATLDGVAPLAALTGGESTARPEPRG